MHTRRRMSDKPIYQVGDIFRISTPRLFTSGVITKIARVNLYYDAVYGLTGEVMHLKLPRHEMKNATILRPNIGVIQEAKRD